LNKRPKLEEGWYSVLTKHGTKEVVYLVDEGNGRGLEVNIIGSGAYLKIEDFTDYKKLEI
jgi:hypothetical protein